AALDPVSAVAYLDRVIAWHEERLGVLDGDEHLQTLAEVREHEAARAALEHDHGVCSAARAMLHAAHRRPLPAVHAGEHHAAHGARPGLHKRPHRVIVADDDAEIRALVTTALRHDGHDVVQARDGLELLTLLSKVSTHEVEPPEAII